MFSKRVPSDLRPNKIARALAARGGAVYDLTVSNPTRCGFDYPSGLLQSLADEEGLSYRPDPLGLRRAREAIAAEYSRRNTSVDLDRVVLTASTSEAYGFLFKSLCDPGDTVLIPSPSYPLFEHLASLEGVRPRSYGLDPESDWQPGQVEPVTDRTRALIAVHPNNPTGTFLDDAGTAQILRTCRRHGMALIVDEVFLDYRFGPLERAHPMSFAGRSDVLTFTLGGLSKSLGLPQLKVSWIVVSGPDRQVEKALDRLAFVADNYLTVGTPVQVALPGLFRDAVSLRSAIRERCRQNLLMLTDEVSNATGVSVVTPEGGWTACLRFPAVVDEETLVLDVLTEDDVAVHPGYFFDFPGEGYVVLSLLPETDLFASGVRRLLRRLSTDL